jgi:hypothetical protein
VQIVRPNRENLEIGCRSRTYGNAAVAGQLDSRSGGWNTRYEPAFLMIADPTPVIFIGQTSPQPRVRRGIAA